MAGCLHQTGWEGANRCWGGWPLDTWAELRGRNDYPDVSYRKLLHRDTGCSGLWGPPTLKNLHLASSGHMGSRRKDSTPGTCTHFQPQYGALCLGNSGCFSGELTGQLQMHRWRGIYHVLCYSDVLQMPTGLLSKCPNGEAKVFSLVHPAQHTIRDPYP